MTGRRTFAETTSVLVLHSIKNGSDTFCLDFYPETPHSFRIFFVFVRHSAKQFFRLRH
jgi:hypothetical protein